MTDEIGHDPPREDRMRTQTTGSDAGWRSVADELASALRATILRNPAVTARDWDQAQAALGRYELAGGERPAALPERPE